MLGRLVFRDSGLAEPYDAPRRGQGLYPIDIEAA